MSASRLIDLTNGSPPRAWAKRRASQETLGARRFTPTRVGKTERNTSAFCRYTVHPHARGENFNDPMTTSTRSGSPPRAWGKRRNLAGVEHELRFTPTRVGKTNLLPVIMGAKTVHPHARGENSASRASVRMVRGSPPRAWGKQVGPVPLVHERRFTPTRVGKTMELVVRSQRPTVHPHARGENSTPRPNRKLTPGSPPRAWGKRLHWDGEEANRRFTPTRVGKTWLGRPPFVRAPVHPHARGENGLEDAAAGQHAGSPPRAWGKHPYLSAPSDLNRFTPTRVGKTFLGAGPPGRPRFTPTRVGKTQDTRGSRLRMPVHPHARGENVRRRRGRRCMFGSPPRAWGKRGVGDDEQG